MNRDGGEIFFGGGRGRAGLIDKRVQGSSWIGVSGVFMVTT